MKTFEQIKEDLLKVKEKIESSVNKENTIAGEIGAIIDGIITEDEAINAETVDVAERAEDESAFEETSETVSVIEGSILNDEINEEVGSSGIESSGEIETIVISSNEDFHEYDKEGDECQGAAEEELLQY